MQLVYSFLYHVSYNLFFLTHVPICSAGDFAVLLKAGMTVRQAILYNVLSAMMAYLGMITGILIGHYAENISMWIFALTAGLFMYVALVDMVSHIIMLIISLHNKTLLTKQRKPGPCCRFINIHRISGNVISSQKTISSQGELIIFSKSVPPVLLRQKVFLKV